MFFPNFFYFLLHIALFIIFTFYSCVFLIAFSSQTFYQTKGLLNSSNMFSNETSKSKPSVTFWTVFLNNYISSYLAHSIHLTAFIEPKFTILSGGGFEGKSGFFYYLNKRDGDNLSDFLKNNLVTQHQFDLAIEKVKYFLNITSRLKIPLLFVIGPNKHSIYPEFFSHSRPEGITRADQLTRIFDSLNATYVFPRDFFLQVKSTLSTPLYFETDTHWNSLGAFYAFQLIKQRIQAFFPNVTFPDIHYDISSRKVHGFGDMLRISHPIKQKNPFCTIVDIVPSKGSSAYYNITYESKRTREIQAKSHDSSLPRALVFRDSFFISLIPFVSPLFSFIDYHWTKWDTNRVLEAKPNLIIFEMVERHCHYYFQ